MSDVQPTLTALGFCGADDSIHPHQLAILCHAYPNIEFGVLFRPDKEGTPRYASSKWVEELGLTSTNMKQVGCTMKLAAHLCGTRVNDLLDGNSDDFLNYLDLVGFQRVQINATAVNGVQTAHLTESVPALWKTIQNFPQLEFILQKNEETQPLWQPIETLLRTQPLPNVAMLVDESKGTGIVSSSWPIPSNLYKTGYAGGIGPSNINQVIQDITQVASQGPVGYQTFWIDMESSLRSTKNGDDIFDLDKCFQVIDAVCTLKLMDRPKFLKN
jgi:phosphoribosylanthranilate isomerase